MVHRYEVHKKVARQNHLHGAKEEYVAAFRCENCIHGVYLHLAVNWGSGAHMGTSPR